MVGQVTEMCGSGQVGVVMRVNMQVWLSSQVEKDSTLWCMCRKDCGESYLLTYTQQVTGEKVGGVYNSKMELLDSTICYGIWD